MEMHKRFCLLVVLSLIATCALSVTSLLAAPRPGWGDLGDSRGDQMIEAYFREETADLADACMADIRSLDQWKTQRELYHKQLLEMQLKLMAGKTAVYS